MLERPNRGPTYWAFVGSRALWRLTRQYLRPGRCRNATGGAPVSWTPAFDRSSVIGTSIKAHLAKASAAKLRVLASSATFSPRRTQDRRAAEGPQTRASGAQAPGHAHVMVACYAIRAGLVKSKNRRRIAMANSSFFSRWFRCFQALLHDSTP